MEWKQLPYDGRQALYSPEEGVSIIVHKCKEAPYVMKGRKEPEKYYCCVASFDIETSKLENENWTADLAAKYKYFNYTFCWQFMIEDQWIMGRCADEFFWMIRKASEKLDGTLIIWIHNAAYEVNNLADFFLGEDCTKSFWKNTSTPLFVKWERYEFRCSAQLTHKSLAQLGADVGIEKLKDDFDYNRIIGPNDALSDMDFNYCYRDVKILYEWVKKETSAYCESKKKTACPVYLPYTQTGYVRKDMQHNFSNTKEGYHVLKETELTQREYEDIRPGFFGGYVHGNYRVIGVPITDPFLHVDIISAYPYLICNGEFMWKLTPASSLSVSIFLKNLHRPHFGQIGDFDLVGVDLLRNHVPYIPYIEGNTKVLGENVIEENGKVIRADLIRITCCDTDMRLILANYKVHAIRIRKLYTGTKRPLPYHVVDTVLQYYEKKTALKGLHSPDGSIEYEYNLNKQKQNSCYGMAAQDRMLQSYRVNPETLEVELEEQHYEPSDTLPYQWAMQITAYVREVIYGFITWLSIHKSEGNLMYYSDTDSVFCKDTPSAREYIRQYNEKVLAQQRRLSLKYFNAIPKNKKGEEKPLGLLALEDDCLDAVEFMTIGAKRYYITHKDGTTDITFSGLRATKTWEDDDGIRHNGRNTERLIEKYGSVREAFLHIKDSDVFLPYEEGTDKLSNYNVRGDFVNRSAFGYEVRRPCTYTLFGMATRLSLNTTLFDFLRSLKGGTDFNE